MTGKSTGTAFRRLGAASATLAAFGLVATGPVPGLFREGQASAAAPEAPKVSEAESKILAAVLKQAEDVDFRAAGVTNREGAVKELSKRAEAAYELVKELQSVNAKSPVLAEAALAATKPAGNLLMMGDAGFLEKAKELAGIAKATGSAETAAGADAQLLKFGMFGPLAGVRSLEDAKAKWAAGREAWLKDARAALAAHPKSKTLADFFAEADRILNVLGEGDIRNEVLASIAKNLPDHALAKVASRASAVGKEFVFEFKAVGADKASSIKDLRGKVVVIDFWATWCPPCRAEMPHMKELYAKYKAQGLEIVGVSLDRDEATLTAYCKTNEIGWIQVFGDAARKLSEDWGVEGIPTLYIIDKAGNLRSMEARGKLDTLIPELLKEEVKAPATK